MLRIQHAFYLALPSILFRRRWVPYWRTLEGFFHSYSGPAPDIVQVEWVYPDAYAVLKLAKAWHKKVVITVHGRIDIQPEWGSYHPDLYTWALNQADHVICVSRDLKYRIAEKHGVPEARITVVPNGIDSDKFHPMPRASARKALNLPPDRRIILTVARLSSEKALHVLIRAVSICRTQDFDLIIVGDGPLKGALTSLIHKLKLQHRVFLVGGKPHDEIPWWLCASDLFCLSSLHEGGPVVIHEALACGIPVVATHVGGIPEILTRPEYGLLCAPDNSYQLSCLLDQALQQTWNPEVITQHGQQFTWNMAADRLISLYDNLN